MPRKRGRRERTGGRSRRMALRIPDPSPRVRGEGGAKRRVRGAILQASCRVAPLIRRCAAPSPRKRGEGKVMRDNDFLVCPDCGCGLEEWTCAACGRDFAAPDGIPDL